MARLRHALALAVLAIPSLAVAGAPQIRLTAPLAGSVLRGGETAVVAWEAGALPASAEEWEAFLSIDGGCHYAIRITPHLDADIRRATWTVPNVAARDVRMLLRFGDERDESEVEIPVAFSIEGRFDGTPLWPAGTSSEEIGEEARPGDGGVVAWVAGDRKGANSELVAARGLGTMGATVAGSRIEDRSDAATHQRAPLVTPPGSAQVGQHLDPPAQLQYASEPAQVGILLLARRLNI
ncbi:MAG TPA: hypothetical protein VEZ11_03105 [Thermoanaerobaculia bacterium]|nr:hypothetical protein [Thermoanaerobaculia bacterium]